MRLYSCKYIYIYICLHLAINSHLFFNNSLVSEEVFFLSFPLTVYYIYPQNLQIWNSIWLPLVQVVVSLILFGN